MKIKVEHLKNDSETFVATKIYDADSGLILGGVQNVKIMISANDLIPKAELQIVNFEADLEEVEVEKLEVVSYGPKYKTIDDMNKNELIEALKYEAIQRFKLNLKIRELTKKE